MQKVKTQLPTVPESENAVTAVRGNSDDPWKNCGEKSHGLEYAQRVGIANKNFFVTHGDRSGDDDETIFKGRMPQQIMSVYRDQLKGVHFVITGHSHHQHFIEYEGIKFINPGLYGGLVIKMKHRSNVVFLK
ncbi:hypothetical protein TrLO_g5854 [Triparma laevis f. longispina]|uniref:Calcineurin-like phosphoesterase domain-containing protein n=1 Tax=Triparma laevis f. longispina TaxID=1714387 RepID=A0A9W7F2U7_9STRA|nr:hypothetical protein TrLO_g5854 [Triparma laevis f. longispina]